MPDPIGLAYIIIVFLGIFLWDAHVRLRRFQQEAVDRGVARWVENRDGDIEFRWGGTWKS